MPNFRTLVLADPAHSLPMPAPHARLFGERETVDVSDPFWIALLGDKSVVPETDAPAAPEPPPASPEPHDGD